MSAQTTPINPETKELPEYLVRLCRAIHQRANYLGLRNKKADDMVVDFWSGAAAMAKINGNMQQCEHLTLMLAMTIIPRGMFEIRVIIERNKHRDFPD